MARIVSDRADHTDQVVVLPSSLEDPTKSPPGMYRIGVFVACASIFAFFVALVIAYLWRSRTRAGWDPIVLPPILWWSTTIILLSSAVFEIGRRMFRRGLWRTASYLHLATLCLGTAFIACQMTAWKDLVRQGAYLMGNPHGSFFYLFTGLHAAHLIGGMIALAIVVFGRRKRREVVDVVAYYWHFLGVLWIALFVTLRTVT